MDPSVGARQTEKLKKLKASRDSEAVKKSLDRLKAACATDENVMPYLIDAVKTYATLGEICNVMREVFGEYNTGRSVL